MTLGLIAFEVYFLLTLMDDVSLVAAYSLYSGHSRRAIYIMTSLSLVCILEQYLLAQSSSNGAKKTSAVRIFGGISFLYFLLLLLTLIMAPCSNIMYQGYNTADSNWVQKVMSISGFTTTLLSWKIMGYIRAVLCIFAWGFSAMNLSYYNPGSDAIVSSKKDQAMAVEMTTLFKGLARLGGINTGQLTIDELEELVTLQRRILMETEAAIELRQRRLQRRGSTTMNLSARAT